MNAKERVSAALALREPDRIPYGEFSIDSDTVARIIGHETYVRAKADVQIAFWEGRREEVVQSWKEDTVDLFRKLGCLDVINLSAMASSLAPPKDHVPDPPRRIDETTWEDGDGRIYKLSEKTRDITVVHDPTVWTRDYSPEDFPEESEAEIPDDSVFEVIDYVIERIGADHFVLGPAGSEVGMVLLGGIERGLTEYITNPETVKAAGRHHLRQANESDSYYIRPGTDGVFWGQDWAYKNGPLISPAMFREFVLPLLTARVEHVKRSHHLPVIQHACGNNWKLLDMFVEAGFDCYQSIQPTAEMDIKAVKDAYGDRMCLWGGVPVEHLCGGTMEEIREDVRYAVQWAAPGGGFILGASHSIAVGTIYDNYMAMLDEFERLRYCY